MTPTTGQSAAERPERPAPERKEPTHLFTEKYVADKSELARRFIETRARPNANVEKANNFLVKRFYNVDHNTYLEGALPAKTKALMDWLPQPACDVTTAFSITRSRPTVSGCRALNRKNH